jgi:hypothetical protein
MTVQYYILILIIRNKMEIPLKMEIWGALGTLSLTYLYYLIWMYITFSLLHYIFCLAVFINLLKCILNHLVIIRNTKLSKEMVVFEKYIDSLRGEWVTENRVVRSLGMGYKQLQRLLCFRAWFLFPATWVFPRPATQVHEGNGCIKIEQMFQFFASKKDCAQWKIPLNIFVWLLMTGMLSIEETSVVIHCYILLFLDFVVIWYPYVFPIRAVFGIFFLILFSIVYLTATIIIFPFKYLFWRNYRCLRPHPDEVVVPEEVVQPEEDPSEEVPSSRSEEPLQLQRRGYSSTAIQNIILQASQEGIQDVEALLWLRRRMRRERTVRRRLSELGRQQNGDAQEDRSLINLIRNISLTNMVEEYSSVYEKERDHNKYLIKNCHKDIEPFPENWAICLADFSNLDSIIKANWEKMHVFHSECLKEWVKMKPNCPLWRDSFITHPEPFIKPYKKGSTTKVIPLK